MDELDCSLLIAALTQGELSAKFFTHCDDRFRKGLAFTPAGQVCSIAMRTS
ncbi:hypothetical protein NKH36_33935 [Mesorhizobium sp. M1312]|uniref:hypothetical protein n=1 Tax=unclassified Mesorhizobium TaxID=325217 RepID=UPI0033374151